MDQSSSEGKQFAQTGYFVEPMGVLGIVLFGWYFVALSAGAVYTLWAIWPDGTHSVALLGGAISFPAGIELRLILVAVLSGVLGAFIHGATSFATYLGNRQLKRSWGWWYLLRPLIGMALGLVFYFLVRGGFLSPQTDGSTISPYGVAGLAGLVGLFSKQASDKLKDIFEHVFPTQADQHREDGLTANRKFKT